MIPGFDELTAARCVTADGIYNMRDLGGLPRRDGGTVPRGRYYRADNLANLSPKGVAVLLRLGIRTVIDLRRDEAARKYPSPLRQLSGVAYHQVDMIGDRNLQPRDLLDTAWDDADENSRHTALPLFSHLRAYCRWLEERQPQLRTILRLLAGPKATPAVFHCEAGKDRTGVVSALLLLLAQVPDLVIAADYTHTAHNNFRRLQLQRKSGDPPLKVRDETDYAARFCPAELVPVLLFWLRSHYRDVASYLGRIGLTGVEVEALRRNLATAD